MKRYIIIAALALACAGTATAAKSYKRGVSENQFQLQAQMSILEPGVSWYYNWANTPGKGYQGEVEAFDGMEYVPMVWNGNYDPEKIRAYVASHPGCKYLLGFNEPNFTAQANMTPDAAAALWPEVVKLARELGLQIVAPAMNYSPNAPYQDPTKWFDEFVALVGPDAFDFTAVHNYGGLGVMKTIAGTFHEKYGKPVWVTEFCYWPNEGQPGSRVEPNVQIASMVESVEWLETTDWIYRYAWFKPVGKHENTATSGSPCYGLIVNRSGLGERELSPQGYVYTYMSDFDPDRWHAVDTEIAATEYISRTLACLAPGMRAEAPLPIEISQFNAGATLDYQFDVPSDGEYRLTLYVSGQGEPVRFDPSVAIELVEGESVTTLSSATVFSLSGSDEVYAKVEFPVTLEAGHRTLRIADQRPYQPSGMRISSVTLASGGAGVENIRVESTKAMSEGVYTPAGRLLRRSNDVQGLPAGLYIVGGKKLYLK